MAVGLMAAGSLLKLLESLVLNVSQGYAIWLEGISIGNDWNAFALPLMAMGGGLIASISPCVLALLPVQLSYLGTQQQDRPQPAKVLLFTLGVVVVYTMLGLFSSLAGALLIDHRGILQTVTGVIIIVLAFQLAGWFPTLPWHRLNGLLPQSRSRFLTPLGSSFLVGASFALVTSPCASPVLAAVLTAAATIGSPALAAISMLLYAIGYSMVLLLAGLGVELGGIRHRLLSRGDLVANLSCFVLVMFGVVYLLGGLQDLAQQVQW